MSEVPEAWMADGSGIRAKIVTAERSRHSEVLEKGREARQAFMERTAGVWKTDKTNRGDVKKPDPRLPRIWFLT
jgi:hypothetical protein